VSDVSTKAVKVSPPDCSFEEYTKKRIPKNPIHSLNIVLDTCAHVGMSQGVRDMRGYEKSVKEIFFEFRDIGKIAIFGQMGKKNQ
jgi:hypothetical protein